MEARLAAAVGVEVVTPRLEEVAVTLVEEGEAEALVEASPLRGL